MECASNTNTNGGKSNNSSKRNRLTLIKTIKHLRTCFRVLRFLKHQNIQANELMRPRNKQYEGYHLVVDNS